MRTVNVSGSSHQKRRRLGFALAFVALTACSGERSGEPLDDLTAREIFTRGELQIEQGNPEEAAFYFSEIERLSPYSEWAKRALIMQAFAYHRDQDYENSRSASQRFIDFYPDDDDAAYAQYLLALSYYDQIDEVGRDQGLTFQALQSLRQVIERYPDSEYAKSSVLKFDLAFDHLAAKEMEIGRYYLRRNHYTAASTGSAWWLRISRPPRIPLRRCTGWLSVISLLAWSMKRKAPVRSLVSTTVPANGTRQALRF